MAQPSLKISDIIADAAFPQNAKGFLRLPHMQRVLRQMQFSPAEIEKYKSKLRATAYIALAERFGEVTNENGVPTYNCLNVKYELDEHSPNGFVAKDNDAVDRGRHQLFMDEEKFHKRLRELFIQELGGNVQSAQDFIQDQETAPVSIPAIKRPRSFLIRKEELATPAVNM